MTSIIIALFMLAIGLPVPVLRAKFMVEHQRTTHETTLFGGLWTVGENGVQAFLILRELARVVFFPLTPTAMVVGLVPVSIGGWVILGGALSWILLDIVERPRNLVFHMTTFFMTSVFFAAVSGLLIIMEWPLPVAGFVAGFMPFIVVAIVVGLILALTRLGRWWRQSTMSN